MEIFKSYNYSKEKASFDYFRGNVVISPLVRAPEPARIRAVKVSFEPKARTAWHTHPLGQTLYVVSGIGLVGLRNSPPELIEVGDTVWIPPSQEHWHGAHSGSPMVHIAIQEELNGRVADWLEQVSDKDYYG